MDDAEAIPHGSAARPEPFKVVVKPAETDDLQKRTVLVLAEAVSSEWADPFDPACVEVVERTRDRRTEVVGAAVGPELGLQLTPGVRRTRIVDPTGHVASLPLAVPCSSDGGREFRDQWLRPCCSGGVGREIGLRGACQFQFCCAAGNSILVGEQAPSTRPSLARRQDLAGTLELAETCADLSG